MVPDKSSQYLRGSRGESVKSGEGELCVGGGILKRILLVPAQSREGVDS